jgi:hypothetical protein
MWTRNGITNSHKRWSVHNVLLHSNFLADQCKRCLISQRCSYSAHPRDKMGSHLMSFAGAAEGSLDRQALILTCRTTGGNVGVETCPRIWKFIESIIFQLLDARGIGPRSAKNRPEPLPKRIGRTIYSSMHNATFADRENGN